MLHAHEWDSCTFIQGQQVCIVATLGIHTYDTSNCAKIQEKIAIILTHM